MGLPRKKIDIFSRLVFVFAFLVGLFFAPPSRADWPMFGNDLLNSRHQPEETIINTQNVADLQVKWTASIEGFFIKTCVTDESSLYCTTSNSPPAVPSGFVYKLNKANGSEAVPHKDILSVIKECLPEENIPSMMDIQTSPALSGNNLIVTTAHLTPPTELFPACPTVCLDDDGDPNTPCAPFLDPNLDPICYKSPAFPKGGGYVVVLDKNTFACKSATRVTENPFEQILGSTTVATVPSGKNKMKNVAFVGISSGEEGAAGEPQEYPKYPCCTTIGRVCAVNVDTGGKFWGHFCTPLIDADPSTQKFDKKDPKSGVDLEGYSGVTVWTSAPVVIFDNNDTVAPSKGKPPPVSGQVVVTTGNAYSRGTATDPSDLSPFQLAINAFVGIDLQSGLIKNVYRAIPDDFWNTSCGFPPPECTDGDPTTHCNCPDEQGPDYDFGAGASGTDTDGDGEIDLLTSVNKAGRAYGVDASTFNPLWETIVGPTTLLGLGGEASDGTSHFFTNPAIFDIGADNNFICRAWNISTHSLPTGCDLETLDNDPNIVFGPTLTATDHMGNILWQATDPLNFSPLSGTLCDPDNPEFCAPLGVIFGPAPLLGPPTSIPGIVFAESVSPNFFLLFFNEDPTGFLANFCPNFPFSCSQNPSMFAFDSGSGEILWSFTPLSPLFGFLPIGSPVFAGPSISDGVVYWGAVDMSTFGGTSTIYAFGIPSP